MTTTIQLFMSQMILGYFLQCAGCILGIYAVAKRRINPVSFLLSSATFALATYLVRTVGKFDFGIHTMINVLIVNVICVVFLKIDIRWSVLGSLIGTVLVLAGEVINLALLMALYDKAQMTVHLADPVTKAWAAVPGNIVFCAVVAVGYCVRTKKGRQHNGENG